jgi:hypothetical protein
MNQRFVLAVIAASVFSATTVLAAKPKPESRWFKTGKAAHAQVKNKNSKERNRACTVLCKKSGAKKTRDLGACKEGCVFG